MHSLLETHINQNSGSELLALEHVYERLDRIGRPADDTEICDQLRITGDEFHQMLRRIEWLDIGLFAKVSSPDGEPLIRYIPDFSLTKNDSLVDFRRSDIQERLTKAIESLPEKERLVLSLFYYDELTVAEIEAVLGIDRTCVSELHTKAMLRLRSKVRK